MEHPASDRKHESLEDTHPAKTRILVVDDEEPVRILLSRLLDLKGYEYTLASDATEARKCVRNNNFELVLCDVSMPGESGMDFIRWLLAEHPATAVVMVTAMDNPELAEKALAIGAYGYIIKPFKPNEVLIDVANALLRRKLEIENRNHRTNLEQIISERTESLRTALNDLKDTMEGIIGAMALVVEIRDPYTAGHQQRVADLARVIAAEMNISSGQMDSIYMAAMIHDLGKIAVPAEILSKPGQLTEIEFSLIKAHPQAGYEILKDIKFPWPISHIVHQHHERINGSGYPLGLSGEKILLEARIIAVADTVEAMASHRPYRPALGVDKALEEISEKRDTFFDPKVADSCMKVFSERKFTFE